MVTKNKSLNFITWLSMDTKAKSFVIIMIVIAVASFLLRFAAEQIIRINVAQSESNAVSTLKLIAVALENYAKNNKGVFPAQFGILTKDVPAYLDKDYTALSSFKGYEYACPRLESSGYSCIASPAICRITGKTIYTLTTGGVIVNESCSKKE